LYRRSVHLVQEIGPSCTGGRSVSTTKYSQTPEKTDKHSRPSGIMTIELVISQNGTKREKRSVPCLRQPLFWNQTNTVQTKNFILPKLLSNPSLQSFITLLSCGPVWPYLYSTFETPCATKKQSHFTGH
jgi:hypothetical protein